MSLLVRDLRSGYGATEVLHGITVEAKTGTIVTLIGANGAGKTTLLMTICGQPRARAGSVVFENEDITHIAPHDLVTRGIAIVPEGRRILSRMTVLENLKMGTYHNPKSFPGSVDRILAMFPRLKDRLRQRAGTMSGGEQQMLALGRALISKPRLLFLDEPSLGLAPIIAREVFDTIRTINSQDGTTIFLVEQNAFQALSIAHHGYVLANGKVVLSGTGEELKANPDVQSAYLGGAVKAKA
jgi:branched-chain amino acid transport system ATP-binding protein